MPEIRVQVNNIDEVRQALALLKEHGFLIFDNAPDTFTDQAGQLLRCNTAEDALEFTTASSGGTGDAFKTIDCPSGDNPQAAGSDTLVLLTDNNLLTITGNKSSDTVTYAVVQSNIDHGAIGGLADDDHTQYLTNARGDARYFSPVYTGKEFQFLTVNEAKDAVEFTEFSLENITKTASYSMADNDSVILADASAGAMTITLPRPADTKRRVITIKKIDTTNNIVTVATV